MSERVREKCLDFIDTLWSAEGGFHGHWADDHLDAEYTFYGLLALGPCEIHRRSWRARAYLPAEASA